ncbi:MAG: DUF4136 domain-containing protein [Phycisphaerales bacterium]
MKFRTRSILVATALCAVAGAMGACAAGGAPAEPTFATSGRLADAMAGARTVALAPGSGVDRDQRIDASVVEDTLRQAILDALVMRGYTVAPPSRAQRLVGYVAIVDYGVEDAELFARLGVSPGVGAGEDVERGTIALFVLRPGARAPLWRAAGQGVLDPNAAPARRAERIASAVETLLADLPPAP